MRSVAEVAATEGVSHAEAVRLKVNRGQFDSDDASSFIYNLRRYSAADLCYNLTSAVYSG